MFYGQLYGCLCFCLLAGPLVSSVPAGTCACRHLRLVSRRAVESRSSLWGESNFLWRWLNTVPKEKAAGNGQLLGATGHPKSQIYISWLFFMIKRWNCWIGVYLRETDWAWEQMCLFASLFISIFGSSNSLLHLCSFVQWLLITIGIWWLHYVILYFFSRKGKMKIYYQLLLVKNCARPFSKY